MTTRQPMGIGTYRVLIPIFVLVCAAAFSENLLLNPGFDNVDLEGAPEHWDLFVMPMEGALGAVDSSSRGAPFSVKLHNPAAYRDEPANNWSQTIIADLAGETLSISGAIKTEGATEAAIWLQCWSRNPPRVLSANSTSIEYPITGTRTWEPVAMRVEIPERTDFVVIRCVLKGEGTAWFDDLSVAIAAPETAPGVPAPHVPAPSAAATTDTHGMQELLAANTALSEALATMSSQNESLLVRVTSLQDELAALRNEIAQHEDRPASVVPKPVDTAAPTRPVAPAVAGAPKYGPHPLVPVDWVEEDEP